MQVMGATARELGFKGWLGQLLCPDEGLLCGVKYLHKQFKRFGSRGLPAVIAAYNAGSPRTEKSGAFKNQAYVDKVMTQYQRLLDAGADKGTKAAGTKAQSLKPRQKSSNLLDAGTGSNCDSGTQNFA